MELEDYIVEAIRLAVTKLPDDTVNALKRAYEKEENPIAKLQLENILKTIELGKDYSLPMCQDTGTLTFFVEAGIDNPHLKELKEVLINATKRATKEIPLRPNAVDVLTNRNSGDNTGRFVPIIHWELIEGDKIKIIVFPKGGGSENCSALAMLNPSEGLEGVKHFVVEHIKKCGGKPCPPVILGIGVGGGADFALKLAKKALLRPLGARHKDERIAELEEELLNEVNALGIGPMGLGGKITALDVKIEYAHRHPASFPVGLVVQCWANRKAFVEISKDGGVIIWQ
ncbi:fumarate hydratase [Palaeococcus pacificus DY20341]|uniref:Fumarate hydratase n=1 Tax=Palaeococcus pacificus DY20341 TaxID=1343739 RepID=A0A075LYA6_9EURY|nr:fumarate hydratase [Palaeococcus pacificus]AIF69573.1 fumarate hydratase [Palaeococcus pacificus DY20341]